MNTSLLSDKLNRHLNFLEQDKDNLTLLLEISTLYLELDDLISSQKYLDRAEAINREACLSHRGLLHLNHGDFMQAKGHFEEALNSTDTSALRYNLGFSHFMTHDFEDAWNVLVPLANKEHHPLALLLMARIRHRQNSLEESLSLIEQILEHNPDNSEALGFLALLYFDMNNEVLASEIVDRALQLDPENYDAKLVDVLLRLLTQETTEEEIEDLLKINPEDCRLWFALGNTQMMMGHFELAAQTLLRAIAIYPDFYDCHIVLAWCQLLSNRIDEAHESYQNAVELVDHLADGWGGLALVYALMEDFPKAEQLIDKANHLNPDCFLNDIAKTIYSNYNNPLEAKSHLLHALQHSSTPINEKLAFIIEEMQQ